jgi:hypothetical protein
VANAVSRSMIAYAAARSNPQGARADILNRYREAVRGLSKARNHLSDLRSSQSTSTTTGTTAGGSSTSRPGSVSRARADVQAQQLRVASLAQLYRSQAGTPSSATVVQRILDAQTASSDRRSHVELYGALGLLAGLCLGTAVAVLLTGRRYRQRLAS